MNKTIMEKELVVVEKGVCPTCGGPITGFKDPLSVKEYHISGMCQSCQDSVFDTPEEG